MHSTHFIQIVKVPLNNSYSAMKLLSPTELQLLLFEANCRKIFFQDKGLTRKLNQCILTIESNKNKLFK